jgi:aminoglycoside phosphotransferase (APT) family kinase protein
MDETTRENLAACRALPDLDLDLDAALRVWDEAMSLPTAHPEPAKRWYHGDLFAENLLVRDGHLTGVLDFGGLAIGDPTIDLVVAWEVLDHRSREVFRHSVGADNASWMRGRAWALSVALMTFPYYWETMPQRCANRLAVARSVLVDAASS